jgi:hypothetical protein
MKSYFEAILDLVILFLFGERTPVGEPINLEKGTPVGLKTTLPPDQPEEYEWMAMFRVSSLHNVNQRIFFESKY